LIAKYSARTLYSRTIQADSVMSCRKSIAFASFQEMSLHE